MIKNNLEKDSSPAQKKDYFWNDKYNTS